MACHTPPGSGGNQTERIAPPPFAIKAHYLDHFKDMDTFSKAMARYLLNPNKNDSMMPEASSNFGTMNKMAYSGGEYRELAKYIFTTEFPEPPGFARHREMQCKNSDLCRKVKETAERIRKTLK
ncbi:MAG: hypothetical protein HC883_03480 [Bdellovibrionaceae bacterium]|nr:hypothetical protein [Pseudobdellovibrionaceae bacterium]